MTLTRFSSPRLITASVLIAGVLLFAPVPESGRTLQTLMNLGHVPLGAGLALLILAALRRRWPARPALVASTAFAVTFGLLALVEGIQPRVGRAAEWNDLVRGGLGAAGAIVLHAATTARGFRRRAGLLAGGVALLALPCFESARIILDATRQRHEMPLLASFESELELTRWAFTDGEASRTTTNATAGRYSLRLGLQPALYPGATLIWTPANWAGYDALAFDIYLEGENPLALEAKITDRQHRGRFDDRFNRTLQLQPGLNRLNIRLDEVAAAPQTRKLDLAQIRRLQFFTYKLETPRTLYIDNIRLEGAR